MNIALAKSTQQACRDIIGSNIDVDGDIGTESNKAIVLL